MTKHQLAFIKRAGTALSIILFPVMLLVGFVLHPNLPSIETVTEPLEWAAEWRGNFLFHIGHLLVLFAVPLIIVSSIHFMSLLNGRGAWYGFIGCVLAVFGAFMLAVDKGALTLGLTAFQTIPNEQFSSIYPALQVLLDKAGWLWILWFLLLLPLGFIIQLVGLLKESLIPLWQGIITITGTLLLVNPDIEIISAIGAALICVGLIPVGMRELSGSLRS
jgi:hypothetical protein